VEKDLAAKLGIRPGSKVCLLRPDEDTLSRLSGGDINLIVNGLEENCDVILYWIDQSEGLGEKMAFLRGKIKPDGRIWVIMPRKEVAAERKLNIDWNEVRKEALKAKLVDNKVVTINKEEYGTQFVIRKKYRKEDTKC
jgi:hypothetical protein